VKIVGNKPGVTILILVFISILIALAWRCSKAADVVVRPGIGYGAGGLAPVLGLDLRFPQGNDLDLYAGTLLWGNTARTDTNWDWHIGFRTCRGHFCASLGAAYLQREDALNGSHANFALGLEYRFGKPWYRIEGIEPFFHLSNAGTTSTNIGRQAALLPIRAN
jgi:hypothetical protein